jgi:hypothetical protein
LIDQDQGLDAVAVMAKEFDKVPDDGARCRMRENVKLGG